MQKRLQNKGIFFFFIVNNNWINRKEYKEMRIRNPQKLYKKGFHSLIRRENWILLKSLQTCNQIATHNLILSEVLSKDSSTSSKILLFRSNQMTQNVTITETFQRIFPLFVREQPWPNDNNSVVEQGIT